VILFTSEVRSLARKAGLEPRAFSYPEEDIDDYGLIKRSSIFSVEGTYPELRQFLYLLEASRSFLTVEEINLAGASGGGPELRIDIAISTLFARDAEAAPPAGTAAAETGGTGTGGAS
jgi:Type II secretion system (T2SS), protein M subtype b